MIEPSNSPTSNPAPSIKLPIFEPRTGTKINPRRVHTIRIAGEQIPATEEEIRALKQKLDAHIARCGVKYGFFASILGEAAAYVSA